MSYDNVQCTSRYNPQAKENPSKYKKRKNQILCFINKTYLRTCNIDVIFTN